MPNEKKTGESANDSNFSIHLKFLASGCNRFNQSLAWGRSGQVAFGAHHTVVLYDPKVLRLWTEGQNLCPFNGFFNGLI